MLDMTTDQDPNSPEDGRSAKPRGTGSLLFRLTVPSLLAVFALWLGYTVFWAEKYETDLRNSFVENGERATDLFSGAVADALWEFDRRSAEATLAGLAEWPGFAFGAILDQSGEFAVYQDTERGIPALWKEHAATNTGAPVYSEDFVFFFSPVVHPVHGAIGQLVAAFDERPLQDAIWAARRSSVVSAAIGFTLLGLLLTQVARSVTRPLVRITDAVERVAAGDLDFEVPDVGTLDEVGRLANALDVFRRNAGRLVEVRSEAEATRRVARLAMIDDLTKLANRRAMIERFKEIDQADNHPGDVVYSIAHIDLDGFKQINDNIGHSAGDFVIAQVGERLTRFSGKCDLIARIGGDEFVLVIPHGVNEDTPQAIAEAILRALNRPFVLENQELRVGASVGIAQHAFGTEKMSDTLMNADVALYRAKAQGKSRVVTFSDTHRQELIARKRASNEIAVGIENGHFVPYFQGIYEAGSHRLLAVEMLARWDHPAKGILTPEHFLKVATDLNLMSQIDKHVFRTALDKFATWADAGIELPALCVNVSVTRLGEPDFTAMLAEARAAGISVEVELLESIYLDDPSPQLLWQLDQIRELGVGLNIDDFGTGHASVAGLLQVKPDKVKIDRRFVIPILQSTRARKLVETLLGLCALLEIDPLAEGVETMEHARVLNELGCRYLQGFALMRPVSAEDLRETLSRRDREIGL